MRSAGVDFLPLASGAAIGQADVEASANCVCTIGAKKGVVAPCSWTPEESQVESCEHQDNANIHCQPFPESVSEEREIHTDYDGCHCHHVKRDSDLPAHFSLHGLYRKGRGECPESRPCFG
jgi:hypothetical protein